MKTIGLLGGTGWSSTIGYYKLLNELVNEKLGGFHSAKILLKSIDYHDIMDNYGNDHKATAEVLKTELQGLLNLKPDCLMICCNSLHKYFDMIKDALSINIPVFHAIDLVVEKIKKEKFNKILLLATKFTMEDGFFAKKLETHNIKVVIPEQSERSGIQSIHNELMQNIVTEKSKNYFRDLIKKHKDLDAVVLGCTEFPLVVDKTNSILPIIDPMLLQVQSAVEFALKD